MVLIKYLPTGTVEKGRLQTPLTDDLKNTRRKEAYHVEKMEVKNHAVLNTDGMS